MIKFWVIAAILFSSFAMADTPPPGSVFIKGGTDSTHIGNVGDSLKVIVTGGGSTTSVVSGGVSITSSIPLVISGGVGITGPLPLPISASSLPLPTNAAQEAGGNLSAIYAKLVAGIPVLQSTSPWVVSGTVAISNFPAVQTVQGGVGITSNSTDFSTATLQSAANSIASSTLSQLQAGIATTANSLPTNAAQESGGHLASIDSKLTSPITITGGTGITSNSTNFSTSALQTVANGIATSALAQLQAGLAVSSLPAITGTVSLNGGATSVTNQVQATIQGGVSATVANTVNVNVTGTSVTQPVSGSITLANGTSTTQSVSVVGTVPVSISGLGTTVTALQGTNPWTVNGGVSVTNTASIIIAGSSTTVPVSGTVTVNGGVSLTSPIPAGSNNIGGIEIIDGAGTNKLLIGTAGNISVSGLTAVGSPPALNPVTISGVDTSGNKQYIPISTSTTKAVIVDGSATTQPVSGNLTLSGGLAVTSNVTPANLGITGSITGTCSTPSTSCPAGSAVVLPLNGVGSARVIVGGTYTGATMNVDGTVDGTTWFPLFTNNGGVGTTYSSSSFSTSGNYRIYRVASLADIRLRASALATGSITATFNASAPSDVTEVVQFSASNFSVGIFGNAGGTGQTEVSVDSSGNVNTNIVNNNAGLATSSQQTTLIANTTGLQLQSGANKFLDVDGSGFLTSGASLISVATNGASTCSFALSGTWSANLIIIGTVNGTNIASLPIYNTSGVVQAGIIAANGVYVVNCAGYDHVDIAPFTYSSGTVVVNYEAGAGAQIGVVSIATNNAGLSTSNLQVTGNSSLATIVTNTAGLATTNNQLNGLQKTQIVDGSGNSVSATNNGLNTFNVDLSLTGASAQTATVNNILTNPSGSSSTDLQGFRSGSVQVISTGTGGNFIFEASDDNVNYQSMNVYNYTTVAPTTISGNITASASTTIYYFPVIPRYMRLRINVAITGGNIQAFSRFSQEPFIPNALIVGQATAGNLQATVAGTVTANGGSPSIVADVTSGAIITTTTSSTLSQGSGNCYAVDVPVTAATGTNETMDIEIQESLDTGTNWVPIWDMPRITTTGSYNTPSIYLRGNRLRYVQTIGGSTPSFTRAISRIISQAACTPNRQLIDRTINLASANSTTATLESEGIKNLRMEVNTTALSGTAVVSLQGSENFQTASPTWVNIGQLTVSSTGSFSMDFPGVSPQAVRAITTSAAGSVTLGYVLIKGY